MCQVLTTCLLQAALLGLVYARFSSPARRAATIKFSGVMAMYKDRGDGIRRLAFRVANVRNHQVLKPEVRAILLRRERRPPRRLSQQMSSASLASAASASAVPSLGGFSTACAALVSPSEAAEDAARGYDLGDFRYKELSVAHIGGGLLPWLGVPSIMAHKVDESSPLYGVTQEELEAAECEIVVLVDCVDETTGSNMQARHSYFPKDIQWGAPFVGVLKRGVSGALTVDFSNFDRTQPLEEDDEEEEEEEDEAEGDVEAGSGVARPGSGGSGAPLSAFAAAAVQ
jgi:hypothetical protein